MGSESLPPQAPKAPTMRESRLRRAHAVRERRRIWVNTEDEAGIFSVLAFGLLVHAADPLFRFHIAGLQPMPPTETSLYELRSLT